MEDSEEVPSRNRSDLTTVEVKAQGQIGFNFNYKRRDRLTGNDHNYGLYIRNRATLLVGAAAWRVKPKLI